MSTQETTPKQPFTRSFPCPICGGHKDMLQGKGKRCYGYMDSTRRYARCTREEHAGGLALNDGDGTFSHLVEGQCQCGVAHAPASDDWEWEPPPTTTLGEEPMETVSYEIRGPDGALHGIHWRRGNGPGKEIWWQGLNGTRPADLLYRAEHLNGGKGPVVLTEGEPAADAAAELGFESAGTVCGAASTIGPTVARLLAGREVWLWPDNDEDGARHMERNAAALRAAGAIVRMIKWAAAPPKGDAADYVRAGGTREALEGMVGNGPAPRIQVVAIDEFARVEEASAEPLLGDADEAVLPAGGMMVVYGVGGGGKTTLEADMVMHLATGQNWLNLPVPRPCRILMIENEGPRGSFRRKLRSKLDSWGGPGITNQILVAQEPWARFTFKDEELRRDLTAILQEHEVDIIAAGPVTRLGMEGGGTLEEVGEFLDLIEAIRGDLERPLAVLLVHHENRAGTVSGAWEGFPDTLVHVMKAGNGMTRVNWEKTRWASALHGKTWKLRWREGESFELDETPEVTDEEVREAVRDYVAANPGCSANALDGSVKESAKVGRERVRKARTAMVESGDLVDLGGRKGGKGGGGIRLFTPEAAEEEGVRRSPGERSANGTPPTGAPGKDRSPFADPKGKAYGGERSDGAPDEEIRWHGDPDDMEELF